MTTTGVATRSGRSGGITSLRARIDSGCSLVVAVADHPGGSSGAEEVVPRPSRRVRGCLFAARRLSALRGLGPAPELAGRFAPRFGALQILTVVTR
jgi:hypothetical protein